MPSTNEMLDLKGNGAPTAVAPEVMEAGGNGSAAELYDLLNAMQAMRVGDFSVRMPASHVGILGKIADTFNERIREVFFAGQPSLLVSNISPANAGNYTVVISNPYGSVTSSVVTLTPIVQPAIGAITVQPDASILLNFTGTPNASHRLWMSTNLAPPMMWSAIATNTAAANGTGQLVDTNTQATLSRFYRISLP